MTRSWENADRNFREDNDKGWRSRSVPQVIARAILKDPPILVLDEAISAVDNETEAAIQKSLQVITRNRTSIAIAHRLSTIRQSDCIYVMDQGQIAEHGTHEELLILNGIYADFWHVQAGDHKLPSTENRTLF